MSDITTTTTSDFNIFGWDSVDIHKYSYEISIYLNIKYALYDDRESSALKLAEALEAYASDLRKEYRGEYSGHYDKFPSGSRYLMYGDVKIENFWENAHNKDHWVSWPKQA